MKYQFCSSQINLPIALEMDAIRVGLSLPKSGLSNGKLEDRPHVTIKYGLNAVSPEVVRELVGSLPAFNVQFGALGLFEKAFEDVLYVTVKDTVGAGGLSNLRKRLDQLEKNGAPGYARYQPHVTIAYMNKDAGKHLKGVDCALTGKTMLVDAIMYCDNEGVMHECSLKSGQEKLRPADLYSLYQNKLT